MSIEIQEYVTSSGKSPFGEWFQKLKDIRTRAIIRQRIDRVQLGNFGDCKVLGDEIYELRINFGPGYRVYYGKTGNMIVILLCGGSKKSQNSDIQKAKKYWLDYQRED
ncbi:type II toxin-antitoxin system RelE/ParE family toxin [Deltaproteobacteria bacterium TL4]